MLQELPASTIQLLRNVNVNKKRTTLIYPENKSGTEEYLC